MTESISTMLAREAEEAEARAAAEDRGDVQPTRGQRARRQASDPSQVYTVRIPVDRLEELRRVAEQRGEAPSALLRRWALERLDSELGRDPLPDGVGEAIGDVPYAELKKVAEDAVFSAMRRLVMERPGQTALSGARKIRPPEDLRR
jgi:hypothetical protein